MKQKVTDFQILECLLKKPMTVTQVNVFFGIELTRRLRRLTEIGVVLRKKIDWRFVYWISDEQLAKTRLLEPHNRKTTEEQRAKWREVHHRNRIRISAWSHDYNQKRRNAIKVHNKEYHADHPHHNKTRTPEQAIAHNYVQRHRTELLQDECEICGSKENLQTHHLDYSYPSIVVTLCACCHMWQEKGVMATV